MIIEVQFIQSPPGFTTQLVSSQWVDTGSQTIDEYLAYYNGNGVPTTLLNVAASPEDGVRQLYAQSLGPDGPAWLAANPLIVDSVTGEPLQTSTTTDTTFGAGSSSGTTPTVYNTAGQPVDAPSSGFMAFLPIAVVVGLLVWGHK